MVGCDDTPDGPKWTAQSEGVEEYERAPDGPKWTAQSTDEGEGRWRGEGLKVNTLAVPIRAAQKAVGE